MLGMLADLIVCTVSTIYHKLFLGMRSSKSHRQDSDVVVEIYFPLT